jgi:hypothetical protein
VKTTTWTSPVTVGGGAVWAVATTVVGLGLTALTEATVSVVAAVLSVDAAASITKGAGVSAGAAGALPANGLPSGTVPGFCGAATAVVALTAPTGSDAGTAAAPDFAGVPEVSVPEALVAGAGGAADVCASLSAPV